MLIRIELSWPILIARFSNFLRNSTIHFYTFLYLATCFLRILCGLGVCCDHWRSSVLSYWEVYGWHIRAFSHGGMITGGLIRKRVLLMTSSLGTAHKKLKWIDRFGHANWVNSIKFNDRTLRFAEKFDQSFSLVFIFGNLFSESRGFISVAVIRSNNIVSFTN